MTVPHVPHVPETARARTVALTEQQARDRRAAALATIDVGEDELRQRGAQYMLTAGELAVLSEIDGLDYLLHGSGRLGCEEDTSPTDDDVLARAAALAGPPAVWRPDTAEERAERSAITAAMQEAQMESIVRRDEEAAS